MTAFPLLAGATAARGAYPEQIFPAQIFADGATLLVAGSERGRLDRWAELMAPSLARLLPAGTALRRQLAGGDDGVTGANQFEARVTPDGHTVLLLPGQAASAWLAGDPRARFDASRWVPVMAGWTPAIVASRVPLAAMRPGARLRIAASDPGGPDVAALLGLELLRVEVTPVFRIDRFEEARAALDARVVDAVFLRGEGVPAQAAELAAAGVSPLFSLGLPDEAGGMARDPLFAEVPTLPELLATTHTAAAPAALFAAWRAAAAAAQLDFALVLPPLTPATMVALWRRVGTALAAGPEMQPALDAGVRAVVAPSATGSLAAGAAAMIELRRWLAERYNWQPG